MNYSLTYFGKELIDLNYEDIENFFIEPRLESITLEFKSYSAQYGNFQKNLDGVARGICALLNSDGGILVWGSPVGTKSNDEEYYSGKLQPHSEMKSKDWLMNKLSDSISPLPIGIKVQCLNKKNDYIYLFEVSRSDYSPHQFKNTYYARIDGQSKPAPHYLVEALFRKIKFPQIEGYIQFDKLTLMGGIYCLDISIIIFNFSPLQNEENLFCRVIIDAGKFDVAFKSSDFIKFANDKQELFHKGFIEILSHGQPVRFGAKIAINPHYIGSHFGNKLNVILAFGGKASPMKHSSYILDLSKFDSSILDDANYLLEGISENQLPAEFQRANGINKEDQVKIYVKR